MKITTADAENIRNSNLSAKELAGQYGVSPSYIYTVRNGIYRVPKGQERLTHRKGQIGRPRKERSLCACGCGEQVNKPNQRFVYKHHYRMPNKGHFGKGNRVSRKPMTKAEIVSNTFVNCVVEDRGYESPCIVWQGSTTRGGYATFRQTTRHRLIYQLLHPDQEIPKGHKLECHHACHTKACMRPDHLILTGKRPHIRTHRSPLTQADVDELKELRRQGVPYKELAERYGMHWQSLCNIVNGRRWAD